MTILIGVALVSARAGNMAEQSVSHVSPSQQLPQPVFTSSSSESPLSSMAQDGESVSTVAAVSGVMDKTASNRATVGPTSGHLTSHDAVVDSGKQASEPGGGRGGGGGGKKGAVKNVPVTKAHTIRGGVESVVGGGSLPTRSSQRQIKRPKTDDELIDFECSSRSKRQRQAGTSSKTAAGVSMKVSVHIS